MKRQFTVAKLIHWRLCEKHNLERKEKWYEQCPEGVLEDHDVRIVWDIDIQCDNVSDTSRLDFVLLSKKANSC